MTTPGLFERAEEAAGFIRGRVAGAFPRVAIVLGSGLGALADWVKGGTAIPYGEIPHFPVPSVSGHSGQLVTGDLGGAKVAAMRGRIHHYEGHEMDVVTFPIRVLARLGVKTLVLTAAAGGIRALLEPGDLVLVRDHLNMMGVNPLRGPNDDRFGPRFPDMTEVYARRLCDEAHRAAESLDDVLKNGIYAAMPGPSYETPSEIFMLRQMGADVVGMSTVPEAIVARQCGLEVVAFAVVTNPAAGMGGDKLDHAEVLEVGRKAGTRLGKLIAETVRRLPESGSKAG